MGGKNTKICTTPNNDKRISVAITLRRNTITKQVSLEELEFRRNVPSRARRYMSSRICAVSNDFYLISHTMHVVKLQLSTGEEWDVKLPGYVDGLFSLEKNRAAAAITKYDEFMNGQYHICLLTTEHALFVEKVIKTDEDCNGVAQIETMLYVGHPQFIAFYDSSNCRTEGIIFEKNLFGTISSIAKGQENTLVCLHSTFFGFSVDVLNTNGECVINMYSQNIVAGMVSAPFKYAIRSDLKGNVYIFNHRKCCKITDNNLKKFKKPETDIVDVCYDANIEMLVLLHSTFLVLKSPNSCRPTDLNELEENFMVSLARGR